MDSYTRTQVLSVLIIAAGVAITTLSASQNPSAVSSSEPDGYYTGITFLVLALFISGTLGIVQEWTYTQCHHQASDPGVNGAAIGHFEPIPWQESLFYLHFLALPMFIALGPDILNQLRSINTSPHVEVPVTIPPWVLTRLPALQLLTPKFTPLPLGLTVRSHSLTLTLSFPRSYLPLLLNALTQLVCVAGVNRLTTNVSNLTVTLILAVRKAVSVLLSVILFDRASASNGWMWFGAALVSLGTVGYASERMDDGFREKND
jgi:UDP-xylose/UDP-N-acetylglucosamine transporter B4